jgi:tRNA dimethylallyltransferase
VKRTGKENRKPVIALVGPTASGKTELAITVAQALGTEIINVDSRQIYRRLDIGTAKPTPDQIRRVRHHLIDLADPDEPFSAGSYRKEVVKLLPGFDTRGMVPFFVGGTGFYLKAVLEGLCPAPPASADLRRWLKNAAAFPAGGLHGLLQRIDPDAAAKIHPNDSYRLTRALEVYYLTGERLSSRQERHRFADRPFRTMVIGIRRTQEELKSRIGRRLEAMLEAGFAEEVAGLLEAGYDPALPSLRAVGYPQMIAHVIGETSLEEALEKIRRATWQYARRQMTWFRAVPDIIWIEADPGLEDEVLAEKILALLRRQGTLEGGEGGTFVFRGTL